jgi:hypothetical protein
VADLAHHPVESEDPAGPVIRDRRGHERATGRVMDAISSAAITPQQRQELIA